MSSFNRFSYDLRQRDVLQTAALRKHFCLDKVCDWIFQDHLSLDNLAIKSRIAAVNDSQPASSGDVWEAVSAFIIKD